MTVKEKKVYSLYLVAILCLLFFIESKPLAVIPSIILLILLEQRYTQAKILRKNNDNYNQV